MLGTRRKEERGCDVQIHLGFSFCGERRTKAIYFFSLFFHIICDFSFAAFASVDVQKKKKKGQMGEARATLRAAWPHHEQEGCLASEEAEATQCSAALLQQLVAAATWTTRELEAKTALLVVPAPAPAARPGLPKEAPSSSLVDGKKRRRQQQPPPSAVAAEEAPLPLVLRPNRAAAVAGEEREGWREDIEASTRHHRMLAVARAALPRARGHSGGAAGGASMNSGGLLSRKRVRGEQPAAGPWPAEAWLGGLAELTLLASDFDQHVWPWLLTHPAATRSDSLRLALVRATR